MKRSRLLHDCVFENALDLTFPKSRNPASWAHARVCFTLSVEDSTQTEAAGMVGDGVEMVRGSEEEDEMAGGSPDAEGGRSARTNRGRNIDRSSGEPRRTLYEANSVHLSFPSKTVELTRWSGTFGSHFLLLFGQWWEGQEGRSECVPTRTAM